MSVSKFTSSSNANDFNVNAQSTYCSVVLTQEYAAGSYTITATSSNFDIYLYNADGSNVGYTNIKSITASRGFSKVVFLGMNVGDVVGFAYKTTFSATSETSEVTAGPVALSVSPTTMPNINSTTVLTGLNLATNVTVTFTGTDNVVRNAKNVVRGSSTSLTITRPDVMPVSYSPYAITLTNPGITPPTGSNKHILSNAVNAGANPIWVTSSGALTSSIYNITYSYQVSATDLTDVGSSITYSLTSGALPTGLSLSPSGLISGTPSVNTSTTYNFTLRATDSGGNYVDQLFSITNSSSYTPTTAAAASLTAGNYYFYDSAMSAPLLASYQPSTGLSGSDSSGWIKVFSAPDGGTATTNFVDLNIPFSKILVFAGNESYWGRVNFSSNQVFNTNTTGITGSSGANSFGSVSLKVMLGAAGAHGIYNSAQTSCNWSTTIAGAIGAGYTSARGCGQFPNNLTWGYLGNNGGPVYSTPGGTGEIWITW